MSYENFEEFNGYSFNSDPIKFSSHQQLTQFLNYVGSLRVDPFNFKRPPADVSAQGPSSDRTRGNPIQCEVDYTDLTVSLHAQGGFDAVAAHWSNGYLVTGNVVVNLLESRIFDQHLAKAQPDFVVRLYERRTEGSSLVSEINLSYYHSPAITAQRLSDEQSKLYSEQHKLMAQLGAVNIKIRELESKLKTLPPVKRDLPF